MQGKKAYPYPEIVTGDKWHVMETTESDPQPKTDNLNRHMTVPMDRECEYCGVNHGRMIRRHELGHAKWSPKTMGKLMRGTRAEAIHALEEVRINYLMAVHDLPINEYILCKEELQAKTHRLIMTASIADLILFILAAYSVEQRDTHYKRFDNTEMYQEVINQFNLADDMPELTQLRKTQLQFALATATRFAHTLTKHKWNQLPSYRKVQKYAEKLSVILNEFMDKPKPDEVKQEPQPQPGQNCGNNTASGAECSEDELCQECVDKQEEQQQMGNGIGSSDDEIQQLENRMRQELIEQMTYRSSSGMGQWGQMEIHEPAMSVNLKGRLKNGRQYRPSDYGYNPKYINRYCVDKKIFKQKQNVKGGTILIDVSGSMSLSGQDILDIMEILPAVNIAMYNGRANTGDLHIIAKNGMRVNDEYIARHSGAGNVVDGPALRWLSTMPARRIWVSDMYVFGIGANSNGYNLLKECYDLCTQHKIINLKDIEEVKEYALKLNQVL